MASKSQRDRQRIKPYKDESLYEQVKIYPDRMRLPKDLIDNIRNKDGSLDITLGMFDPRINCSGQILPQTDGLVEEEDPMSKIRMTHNGSGINPNEDKGFVISFDASYLLNVIAKLHRLEKKWLEDIIDEAKKMEKERSNDEE